MRYISYIILFLCCNQSIAQEPAYFKIGEKELSGIHIYNLFQDQRSDYWIATNNGLYKYDCFEFKQIPIEKAKSNSVFSFKEGQNNALYCHNLAGQIFKITNDSAQLYYQIPEGQLYQDMEYSFTGDGKIVVLGRNVFITDRSKETSIIYERNEWSPIYLFNHEEDIYLLSIQRERNILRVNRLKNDQFEIVAEFEPTETTKPRTIQMNNGLVAIFNNLNGDLVGWFDGTKVFSDQTWTGKKLQKGIFFNIGDDLMATMGTGGIYDTKKPDEVYFKNQMISCFHEDKEGNKLLGTFGEGIILIPNMDFKNLLFDYGSAKITKLCQLDGVLYFATNKGDLYKVSENKLEKLSIKAEVQIEFLEAINGSHKLIFDAPEITIFDPENDQSYSLDVGSPKSLEEIFPNEILFATNRGAAWYDPQQKNRLNLSKSISENVFAINSLMQRCYDATYDTLNRIFYAATVNGLKIGTQNNVQFFELTGEPIIAHDILQTQKKVYVATRNEGVLIFLKGELIDQWNVNSGFISDEVRQIQIQDEVFYGTTAKGFFQCDLNGKIQHTITQSDGLNSKNITDFEVIEDVLWLISDNKLQQVPLNSIRTEKYSPELNYLRAYCNESLITQGQEFDARNSTFNFSFACKSLKYKEDISYSYRLIGLEQNWTSVNFRNRNIEYKSLPAGDYSFEVIANCDGLEGTKKAIDFHVLAPFYQRSWFVILTATSFVSIVLLIYFFQKRKSKRKAEISQKLAKLQLSTLKSQMNPHFLFNSLTSIQDLIGQEKKESAKKYISKFALLVRKILNQSDTEFIHFEDEISLLTIYLELEQLRFKKDFEFKIEFGEIEEIEIPPMLVQPIVENAIKHGLLHKKGVKKVEVLFEQHASTILCRVIDNGIGRSKALKIKKRRMEENTSFAISSIQKRMELLKEVYHEDLGLTYLDLEDEGEVTGTEVIIRFPFRNKF